jgi:hypothetical protein
MSYAIPTQGSRCVVPCVIVAGIICFTMNVRHHDFGIKALRMRYDLQSNEKETKLK